MGEQLKCFTLHFCDTTTVSPHLDTHTHCDLARESWVIPAIARGLHAGLALLYRVLKGLKQTQEVKETMRVYLPARPSQIVRYHGEQAVV